MMLAALLGSEAHVASGFADHDVSIAAQRTGEIAAREIARELHASGGDDFVVREVQPDDFGSIRVVEVAAHRIAHHLAELVEIVRFGEDRTDRAGRVPAFGGFLDDKQDLGHGR